jgi:hypothetical protein
VFNVNMSDKSSRRLLRTTVENRALVFAAGSFIIGSMVGLVAFSTSVAIAGQGSLGEAASITCAILALLVFSAAYLLDADRRTDFPGRFGVRLLDLAALAFSHAAIALLAWSVIFRIVQEAFLDAVVFSFTAALLLGASAALTTYLIFAAASGMTTARMAGSLCVFLVLGVFTAMLTSPDPYWWHLNFSALGAGDSPASAMFNLTLLVGGILITALAHYLTAELAAGPLARVDAATPIVTARRVAGLRTGLVLIGILLALVGVISVDEFEPVHIAVATGMLVVWGIVVFRLHKLVPGLARGFVILGYVFFAIIAASVAAFFTGYYNLTAVELLGFALIFAWLYLLVRNVSAAARDAVGRAEAAPELVA